MKKTISSKEHKVLAELLYRLRVTSGLKQSDMAKLLKVPQSLISKIESGERRVDLIELSEILKILKVNLSDFAREFTKHIDESK